MTSPSGPRWEIALAESGRIPDAVIRRAIKVRVETRLWQERRGSVDARSDRFRAFLAERAAGPITTHTTDANAQHYEVPVDLFRLMLGPRLKYSSCYWPPGVENLAAAEIAMLELTAERAELHNGQRVLDLGCGWGSLSLWLAERDPDSEVVAVSNSRTQRDYIETQSTERGLGNLTVITADIAQWEPPGMFDRIVSVEMLEHVRNHRVLLARLANHLHPEGRCFVHVFSHRTEAWHFDADDPDDWMARHFFAGGTMPSDDLLLHEQRDLCVVDHWRLAGTHYQRTLDAWLARLDARRAQALAVLGADDDSARAQLELQRWRLFLMGSAEFWGTRGGREFLVSHYLFARR